MKITCFVFIFLAIDVFYTKKSHAFVVVVDYLRFRLEKLGTSLDFGEAIAANDAVLSIQSQFRLNSCYLHC